MSHLVQMLLLAAAGGLGTLLRAGSSTLAVRLFGQAFPWGTLAVNVAGSFAFGLIHAQARSRGLAAETEAILLVGLLGGFTSYSSFAFQSAEMVEAGRPAAAVAYAVVTNALAVAAVWAGLRLGR